jgi:superfamily II DNA or RNA helicase
MISLRPHQERAIEMLRDSLRKGNKRIVLAAPCSFGKTRVAAYILAEAAKRGKKGVFICDRIKLVQQALDSFDEFKLNVGVIQGDHWRWNPDADIQICSIQTLARRQNKLPFDIAVVDECHTHYETLSDYMNAFNAVPFIGLSATPFSKGLGKWYTDLVVPSTPIELLDENYLTPVRYWGGKKANVKGLKRRALKTGGTDYDPNHLGKRLTSDNELTGDIIKNWKLHGEDSQTIMFCPTIAHSKHMVERFNESGISAEHIDGYMPDHERQMLFEAHDNGEFKILSCSKLLNTGYDAPKVRCLIDAYPTKSLIQHVQRAGRIMRLAEGKEYSIYLDHAGNISNLGMPEYIIPEHLDDGEDKFDERKQTKKEKKETKPKECPQCYSIFTGLRCSCGYEVPREVELKDDGSILEEIKDAKRANRLVSGEAKARFFGDLVQIGNERGYKRGWAMNKYRERFGVYPNKITPVIAEKAHQDTLNWITHSNIKWSRSKR